MIGQTVEIPAPPVRLTADLWVPPTPAGLVIFAHCNGTGRLSSRNRQVASALTERGFATLLLDLLAPGEDPDHPDASDIESLSERLLTATRWAMSAQETDGLPVGYLSASTGVAAALCAAAELGEGIRGVVSRGGRPDLACDCLGKVKAPTLLIVGADQPVRSLNEQAADRLCCPHELREIPGATQLFEEPGAPDRIAALTAAWFTRLFPLPKVPAIRAAALAGRPKAVTGRPKAVADRPTAVAAWSGSARRGPAERIGVSTPGAARVFPDDRRSDWAYIPWTRVKSKGGSRWLAS
jgi:putative phosphoribosyl transferase